jgi:septal ring-binding cell division protein DamX
MKVAPNGEYIGWHCEGDISSDKHWRCDKKTLKNGQVVTTATAVEAPPPAVAEPMPAPQPAAASSEVQEPKLSGYTIQLGAFDNPEQAQTVAAGLGVEGDIQIRQIISRGTTFSVILMGQYSSRAEANAVAETLSINYWVRSLRSLVNAAVQ